MMASDLGKTNAAAAALDHVKNGMIVGLGTGSTAGHFVRLLGARVAKGLNVRGIPTSEATRQLALTAGVPLIEIDQAQRIDLTVDGADEVDPALNLIKGGGGALLREKIVANASDDYVVIVDSSKLVERLGAFPLPIEVVPFGFTITAKKVFDVLREARCPGLEVRLREAGPPGKAFMTDTGNYILDAYCREIADPFSLAGALRAIPGVVEHGLFLTMARTLIIGGERGVEVRER